MSTQGKFICKLFLCSGRQVTLKLTAEEVPIFVEKVLCSMARGEPAGPLEYKGYHFAMKTIDGYFVPMRARKEQP